MTIDRPPLFPDRQTATFRYALPEDVPAIHAMTQVAYAGYRDLLPYSSLWQETEADVAQELAAGAIVLCEISGQIVGGVRCQVRNDVPKWQPFVYVHRLAVMPQYQRQGIGRQLMQAVEAFAQKHQVNWVRLEYRLAQPENQLFYDRLGYQTGAVSRFFADGSPRSVWMLKAVS